MLKFFRIPFALSGDKTAIPDDADPNGNVSFEQGYGYDYQRQKTDPAAKNIERDKTNALFFDLTAAVAEIQKQGIPDFITPGLNGGSPYGYTKNAIVRYSDGQLYFSLENDNTAPPTDATKWRVLPKDAAELHYTAPGTGGAAVPVATVLFNDAVCPDQYGAIGDGVADDLAAFAKAFAVSKRLRLSRGKTYWLGNITSPAAIFNFTGNDWGIDFNGAKIRVTTVGTYQTPLFQLDDLDGFTLIAPVISDSGYVVGAPANNKGITAINFNPVTGPVRNIRIVGAKFSSMVAPFGNTSAINSVENIWFDGECRDTYYGLNLANNGHNLWARYSTYNCVRSYFCYGVRGHDVDCISNNHQAASNGDFLIKVKEAAFPTENIRARFVSVNSQATTNPQLVFESQNDVGDAVIKGVTVHYEDTQSPLITKSIDFRHFNNASVLQATDPNTKSQIVITGHAIGAVAHSSTPVTAQDQNYDACLGVSIQPAFCAVKSSSSLNVTGDGTIVDVVFDSPQVDLASNYDNTTGVFTAPRDGIYSFHAQVALFGISANETRSDIKLVTTSLTFNATVTNSGNPPFPENVLQITVPFVFMKKDNTAKIQIVLYNGTKTVDIVGDSVAYTYFSGGLVRGGPTSA